MSDVQEILVIAKINRVDPGWVTVTSRSQDYAVGADWADRIQGWGDTTQYASAAVLVDVASSNNLAAATTAAQNIARALAKIEAELQAMNSNTVISWDGHSMTAGQILTVLNSTKFVVTDNSQFNNGGVGAADGRTDTVTLYYGAYDGIGTLDYAHPNYQNDAGLMGILLHDIGHVTPAGESFLEDSFNWYQSEHGTRNGFYADTGVLGYARNNEKFANDFAYAVGTAFGPDTLTGVNLVYGTGAVDPLMLYNAHIGN